MLGWFPQMYEDELLYSIIARFYKQSSFLSVREVLNQLLGSTAAILTPEFPSKVSNFSEEISTFREINNDLLIYQHTPLAYYISSLNKVNKADLIEEFIIDQNNALAKIGLLASKVRVSDYFKYCPKCLEEDYEIYGESFWRVSHQLPSILMCTKHHCFLHYSSVEYRHKNSELFIPDKKNCDPTNKSLCVNEVFSENELEKLLIISNLSIEILERKREIDISSKNYKQRLSNKGLLSSKGNVKQNELYQDFVSFYGLKVLGALQSIPSSLEGTCWLRDITRKHRKSFHPLRHIVLANLKFPKVDANICPYSDRYNDQSDLI